MFDELSIEILPDGTIKIETDKISGPNHVNAERFLDALAQLTNSKPVRTPKSHAHHEHHTHEHEKTGH